jgi:hypothetical protein
VSTNGGRLKTRPWLECAVAGNEKGHVHGRVDHSHLGTSLRALTTWFAKMGEPNQAKICDEHASKLEGRLRLVQRQLGRLLANHAARADRGASRWRR